MIWPRTARELGLFDEDPEDVETAFRQDDDGTTVAVSTTDDDWTCDPQ